MRRMMSLLGVAFIACCLGGSISFAPAARAGEEEKAEQPLAWALKAGEGKYEITVDLSGAPDLEAWAREKLSPVIVEWYPKIVAMLPSDGFEAPAKLTVAISENFRGVAATSGTQIRCAAPWFRRNLDGEARGAVVHELVHVVQQYGRGRRRGEGGQRPPGWLVEGIADQIRWFIYEPETRGAEITRRNLERARYDGSYRVSANFLDWAARTYDPAIVRKLNAAIRSGSYRDDIWKEICRGRPVEELGAEWKRGLETSLGAAGAPAGDDARAGEWKTLFDGKSLDGWHTFGRKDARPGWQVRDGALACADPHDAGDLCTNDAYDWFELELEYRIAEGGNSGILYHVTDEGRTTWSTGPEFQLEDNARAADPVRCGWLYALYQPPDDPKTGKPLDATKPAGEWNRVRLLISPERCEHVINGVKYFDYVLDSDDFRDRVARSKFSRMPHFMKSRRGYIALQGDHGVVAFRNIRLRPIVPAGAAPEGREAGGKESEEGFVPLFSGNATYAAAGTESASGGWVVTSWSDLSKPPPEGSRWQVRDGVLHGSGARGTWLVSEKEYEDFELAFDFRLGPTGNSGCALRAPLKGDPAFDALELQMVDLRYKPDALPSELTGALYRALAPREQVYRPEEWNSYRIRMAGSRIRVILNGATIIDTDLAERQETGKRHDGTDALPLSKRPRRGRIGFQELGRGEEKVEIRNARLRELTSPPQGARL